MSGGRWGNVRRKMGKCPDITKDRMQTSAILSSASRTTITAGANTFDVHPRWHRVPGVSTISNLCLLVRPILAYSINCEALVGGNWHVHQLLTRFTYVKRSIQIPGNLTAEQCDSFSSWLPSSGWKQVWDLKHLSDKKWKRILFYYMNSEIVRVGRIIRKNSGEKY